MQRRFLKAMGTLALGCLAAPALADDGVTLLPSSYQAANVVAAAPPAAPLAQPSAAPAEGPGCCAYGHEAPGNSGVHILAGAGFYYVMPIFESNRAFTNVRTSAVGGTPSVTNSTDFDYNYEVAPRFWLGAVATDGFGFRVSYWHYDENAHAAATLPGDAAPGSFISSAAPVGVSITTGTPLLAPGNADVLTARTNLKLNVWDFEATKDYEAGNFSLLASLGARYAMIRQSYDADVTNTMNDPNVFSETVSLRSAERFTGAGPTAALDAIYPIGDTGFAAYGNVRASLIIGQYNHTANDGILTVAAGIPTPTPVTNASTGRDAAVPEAEVEFGIAWSGSMGDVKPSVRIGLAAQDYFNALNNNNVTGFGASPNTLNGDLTFFGITVTAGLSY